MAMTATESQVEINLVAKLGDLKYTSRLDIRDRAALESNFREKFEVLNRVKLTDSEFRRLLDGVSRRLTTPWSISRTGARATSKWLPLQP